MHLAGSSAVLALATVLASAVITTQSAQAQTFTALYSFGGTDGNSPQSVLVQATDGNFFGTTAIGGAGGANCVVPDGCGTIFKITPSGTLTTVYSFCAQSGCTDGFDPGGLVPTTTGPHGTTAGGGTYGAGTVFKITGGGTLSTLHSFCAVVVSEECTDGSDPDGLIQAMGGNLYGTTAAGGTYGAGTVFKMTPSGTLTTLNSFDLTDGFGPTGLVQAHNEDFYGTTAAGGTYGAGTVFKMTPSGTLTTLHSFHGWDGNGPSGLVRANDGIFYGVARFGGAANWGTIFKITPSGTLTRLHSFDQTDGGEPYGPLIQATDGNFYGTTSYGGTVGSGTIFKITASGTLTTLHSFAGTDGELPYAGLMQATNGDFYGTTSGGGAYGDGTVFSLSVGLGPFVEAEPSSGKVGAAVNILGTDLTGSTSVTFNGTAAAFTVTSGTLIRATVPTGATTGTIEVTTSSGTLSSNATFQVLP